MTKVLSRNRDLLIVGAFVLAIGLPFSHRAFHMDDNLFLGIAETILHSPLQPYAKSPLNPYTESQASALWPDAPPIILKKLQEGTLGFESAVHPPLLPYYMALIARLNGGFGERSQHVA